MKLLPVAMTIPGQHSQLPARRTDAGATSISQDDHFHGTTAETGQPARTYAYDPAGNRTSKAENGSTTTYAAANHVNQIPSATGGDAFSSTTYDNNGNLTQMVYGDNSRRILSWDSINRLKEITLQAGATVANGDKKVAWDYNAGSQRYKEMLYTHNGYAWALSSTVYFIWEGGSIIQKRIGGTTAYSCTNYFPEGEIRCLNNSLTRFYHTHDHLGSVYEITNTAGAVQAAYSFAAYGERTKRWGSENTEIAYTGHWNFKPAAFAKQAAADLSLTWYRAYDPKRGVWLSRDPINEEGFKTLSRGDLVFNNNEEKNLYMMVGNNVIYKYDINGLAEFPWGPFLRHVVPIITIPTIADGFFSIKACRAAQLRGIGSCVVWRSVTSQLLDLGGLSQLGGDGHTAMRTCYRCKKPGCCACEEELVHVSYRGGVL